MKEVGRGGGEEKRESAGAWRESGEEGTGVGSEQ